MRNVGDRSDSCYQSSTPIWAERHRHAGRDGYAVLDEARAIETTLGRRVPVAAVTAYAHAEDRHPALARLDQYVAMPVDPAALALAVKALAVRKNSEFAEPR